MLNNWKLRKLAEEWLLLAFCWALFRTGDENGIVHHLSFLPVLFIFVPSLFLYLLCFFSFFLNFCSFFLPFFFLPFSLSFFHSLILLFLLSCLYLKPEFSKWVLKLSFFSSSFLHPAEQRGKQISLWCLAVCHIELQRLGNINLCLCSECALPKEQCDGEHSTLSYILMNFFCLWLFASAEIFLLFFIKVFFRFSVMASLSIGSFHKS